MTESIEYNSIVEFIEKTIKANQVGGSDNISTSTNNDAVNPITEFNTTLAKVNEEVPLSYVQIATRFIDKLVKQISNRLKLKNYPIALRILVIGLSLACAYYVFKTSFQSKEINEIKDTLTYIIGTTIMAFVLAEPSEQLIEYVSENLFGDGTELDNVTDDSTRQEIINSNVNNNTTNNVATGGLSNKTILATVITLVGITGLGVYFKIDKKIGLRENVAKLFGTYKSSNASNTVSNTGVSNASDASNEGSLRFDRSTGHVVVNGNVKNITIKMSTSTHFGINGITIEISGNKVTYLVNSVELDGISYIENKPIATALYLAYLVENKKSNVPSNTSFKSDSEFKYRFEDDGSLTLTNREGKVVDTISVAIRNKFSGNEEAANANITEVCKKIFLVNKGLENETCAKHFYAILGKSALAMLQNIGTTVGNNNIVQALKNADVGIKYEILKNLDWKMKISNGKKEMVDVNQWIERLENDQREGVKNLAKQYRDYLNGDGKAVKDILEHMVNDINNNSRLLDEKYQEAVQQQEELGPRKRRSRLNPSQVANLRAQTINENSILNAPFTIPGAPMGVSFYPDPKGRLSGGFDNNYKKTFEGIKSSLSNYNQKLSSETEKRINKKINDIGILEGELNKIQEQINEYTTILRKEKFPVFNGNVISLSDIEDLIHQYQSNSKKQIKEIVTLTTAFGKIKMSLERQDPNEHESKKNLLFNL